MEDRHGFAPVSIQTAPKRRASARAFRYFLPELVDFILSHRLVRDEADPPLVYVRLLQLERLAVSSRERREEAIARAMTL